MSKKFDIKYWLSDDGLRLLELYSNNGLTIDDIAHKIGCSRSTLNKYAKKNYAIKNAIYKGRDRLYDEVEVNLYKMAKGYRSKKQIITKETTPKGKIHEITLEIEEDRLPDRRAIEFILKQKEKYRDDRLQTIEIKLGEMEDELSD